MYISTLYTTKHFFIFSFSDHLHFEDRTVLTKIDPETHRQLMGSLFSGPHGIPMVKKAHGFPNPEYLPTYPIAPFFSNGKWEVLDPFTMVVFHWYGICWEILISYH